MDVQRKRGCVALLLGFGLSLLPEVLSHVITSNANWVDLLFQSMGAIDLPGLLVAIPLAGGNVHGGNLLVITFVSGLFYTVLLYLFLSLVVRFRTTRSKPVTPQNELPVKRGYR
jgi:hypothetical protein